MPVWDPESCVFDTDAPHDSKVGIGWLRRWASQTSLEAHVCTTSPRPVGTHHTTGKRMAPQHSRSTRNRESFHKAYSVVPSSVDSMMM